MDKWAKIKEQEGKDNGYVADKQLEGTKIECASKDKETAAKIECATIDKDKEIEVAKVEKEKEIAVAVVPSRHGLIRHVFTLSVATVFMLVALLATHWGILPKENLGTVLAVIAGVFGTNEIAKTLKGK